MKRLLSIPEWSNKWDKIYAFVLSRFRDEYTKAEAEALASLRTAKLMSLRHVRGG